MPTMKSFFLNLCTVGVARQRGRRGERAGRRSARDELGRLYRCLQSCSVRNSRRRRATRSIRALGPSMGKSPEAIPNRLDARRTGRRGDHGRLCARRPHQAGQGHSRFARRTCGFAHRHGRARGRAEAGYRLRRRRSRKPCCMPDRSLTRTARAACISSANCSSGSASRNR